MRVVAGSGMMAAGSEAVRRVYMHFGGRCASPTCDLDYEHTALDADVDRPLRVWLGGTRQHSRFIALEYTARF